MLTKDHDFEVSDDDDDDAIVAGAGGGALDQELYKTLKDLVKQVSKKEKLQPWIIFQETCLSEMATTYPITVDEVAKISGVGPGKAKRYGKPFADLIAKYVKQNNIERPQDMIVKSTVNKSGLKVFLIHNIDRKLSLEDIADAKGLSMNEIISELESIVSAGTRVNISHYIDEVMDDDRQKDIYEYFREAESDSVEEALKELGEDEYDEDEVRLVRIKFISEIGN